MSIAEEFNFAALERLSEALSAEFLEANAVLPVRLEPSLAVAASWRESIDAHALDEMRLLFGRPIRWILFLYGGRVVPFEIRRTESAQSPQVQDVRSASVTYGHRFLTTSGRAGRAIKVRSFEDYRARLLEHFVVLDRAERQDRIARELEAKARKLNGRVASHLVSRSALLDEVPDLIEYPAVIAGIVQEEFLKLPPEVLLRTLRSVPSDYPGASLRPTPAGGAVTVVVRVPADAEVWFEGVKTKQTGTERRFVSPPVLPGRYTYDIRATWKENGREVTRSRRVAVQAGGTYRVDLTAAPNEP